MAILALDTALDHCQAAIVEPDGRVLASAGGPSMGNAEAIVGHTADLISAVGWDKVERIAVTIGPGSFTGVRIGLAYAQGLAFPRALPAVGLSTLAVLAAEADGAVLAATDARHGALYAALFGGANAPPPARIRGEDAAALAALHGAFIVTYGTEPLLEGARPVSRLSLAKLASLAANVDPADHPPAALYLAEPDAAPQRHKALARA